MTNKLRIIREERGLNQRELAELTHTAQALVSSIERGTLKPWLKVAKRFSRVLKCPVLEIFPDDFSK